MAISNIIKKIGDKIGTAAVNIAYGDSGKAKADEQVNEIKTVRKMKNVPDQGTERDPLFRMRMNVSNMKTDAQRYSDEYASKMSPKPKRF